MHELENAGEKPDGLVKYAKKLIQKPCYKRAKKFANSILTFRDWGNENIRWALRLDNDSKWMWENGHVAIEDW